MRLSIFIPLILSAALIVISFGAVYVVLGEDSGGLIVHFDAVRRITKTGSIADLFSLIGAGAAIGIINFLLVWFFVKRNKFLAYLLAYFTVFLELLILIAILAIINVNA